MPDMKTALEKIIDDWTNDEASLSTKPNQPTQPTTEKQTDMQNATTSTGRKLFTETTGTTRATFDYIKRNPYVTTVDAVKGLELMGYNPASTTSLISQMVKQALFSRDKDGRLTALVKEYRPLKSATALRTKAEGKRAYTRRENPVMQPAPSKTPEGIAALNAPVAQPTPPTAPQHTRTTDEAPLLTAEQVLKTLSVKEAHALYRELQTMFG